MDYAEAGVDREASEDTVNIISDILNINTGFSGFFELDGKRFGLTTDGVGTKILVAEALENYSTIGIDCIAMNSNDLIAGGLEPVAFVDYIVVEEPDKDITRGITEGLSIGAEKSDIQIVGGELAVMPEVVNGIDIAGAMFGVQRQETSGEIQSGDYIVGFPSNGIHSNGLTLARKILDNSYSENFSEQKTIGEELLEPTRIYIEILEFIKNKEITINGMSHITGGGFENLTRMGDYSYVLEDPLPVPKIFNIIQKRGGVEDREMYKTFNMGMGFSLVTDSKGAEKITSDTDGDIVGKVKQGSGVKMIDKDIEI